MRRQFLIAIETKSRDAATKREFPFTIPAIGRIKSLEFAPHVTILAGENGSGKSTILEAIAVGMGMNAEGGGRNFNFATRESHSELHQHLRFVKGISRPKDTFFLRAESFYNVASEIDRLQVSHGYGGESLHHQSHGESFLALMTNRFGGSGLYILDEPEAALSPTRQLSCMRVMRDLAQKGSQFIMATHSPILMAYPGAKIYWLSESGIKSISYEETEHYQTTKLFLEHRERMLNELFGEPEQINEVEE